MSIISKINQKLLERYPNIWNTKLVWIILIALCVHLMFFFIGLFSHSDPKSMQIRYVTNDYFSNGLILVNIIISILILVGWLVAMFKNNAFKNFYPTSNLKLFGQFVQYFIIVFVSTTFYLSYMFGFETFVKTKYNDSKMIAEIELVNRVYPFLTFEPDRYLITERQYPEIFNQLYCETDPNKIDYNKKTYYLYNAVYQFNEVYPVTVKERDSLQRFIYPEFEHQNNVPLAYSNEQENQCVFYFKKEVVDVSPYISSANLNYGNFSNVFYTLGKGKNYHESSYYYPEYSNNYDEERSLQGAEQNKKVLELLERNDKDEFKKLFSDFLALSDAYKISYNLTPDKWTEMVFSSPDFDVNYFILPNKHQTDDYNSNSVYYEEPYYADEIVAATTAEGNTSEDPLVTQRREFIKNATTKYFYEKENLKLLFENIDEVKNSNYFLNSFPVFLWIAYLFSTLIFSFRVTNLRALLFSIITSGVVSLGSGLIFVLIGLGFSGEIQFFAVYYLLILGAFIIVVPMLKSNVGSKLFRSILINISINGFVSYAFLIIAIINLHQEEACSKLRVLSTQYVPCHTILEAFEPNVWSFIFITIGFVFIYFYSSVIKKWKASAE